MGLRALVVLLLLAGGLGAVLWFTDEKPPTNKLAETPVLEGRSVRDCLRLRWQWQNRAPIEIGRGPDGRFQLQEPVMDLVSAARLKPIADSWDSAQMRATPVVDDDDGRQRTGLAPPELVFSVQWADGVRSDIEVGAPGPVGDTRFVRAHGKIWEGPASLLECLKANVDEWREKAVFANAFTPVTEVKVEQTMPAGKRETLHVKMGGGEWRLEAPVQGRADPVAAQRFVTAVLGLYVDYFPAGAIRPPDRPTDLDILVRGGAGEEVIKLWVERGQLLGQLPRRNNLWFTADSLQYAQIFENATSALRARILVPMGDSVVEQMVEMVVDPGQGRGDRLRLRREPGTTDWRLQEPAEFPAAPTPCNEAANAVQLLVAREFVDDTDGKRPRAEDPRFGLQAGRLTLTLRGEKDKVATTLWFGGEVVRGEETLVYCCRADEPDTVVLVQKGHVDTLRRGWLDYGALRVLRQSGGIDRIDIAKPDAARTFQIHDDGKWALVGVAGARAEVGDVVQEDLCDLVGQKLVDARGPEFETPSWTVQLMRKNGDRLDLIRIFDRGPERVLVVQAGARGPVAFEVSQRLSDSLREFWK